ncbi:MAG: Eco57I restriction-modification methylase domain-containing protein [Armatimonadetes bacterium]|nr:Eco57I restriction-modification methylase domain-containing protein [Armatimonadota bacterium]
MSLQDQVCQRLEAGSFKDNLGPLFYQTLGWGAGRGRPRSILVEGQKLTLSPLAELSGLPVLHLEMPAGDKLPGVTYRRAVWKALSPTAVEHVLVYTTADSKALQVVWARRLASGKTELRTLPYVVGLPGRTTIERLSELAFTVPELGMFGEPPITAVLDKLNRAFDVEAVTKEFYQNYHEIFKAAEQQITGECEDKRLFTQRLFNRLMFIHFLSRKGWLSYHGSKDYLAALWNDHKENDSFYEHHMIPLFFQGLNNPQAARLQDEDPDLFDRIGSVPFLNGGLFEQMPDDCRGECVPDDVFDAVINDLFLKFNFTVTESTPLDIEVAVDPEMLGKVFEELVTGRHESGSYYTPKPIVSFMCREALKGYLESAAPGEEKEAIERFVEEHDPDGLHNPETILDALRRVKVCDPACGSGAYLLGMLHELLDLRTSLFNIKRLDPISMYNRKLEIIENNLYGVDMDLFAVNIARLRLWLSLAVEFDGDVPPPLPNLDFKIEQGDSLSAPRPTMGEQIGMRDMLIQQFREAKARYLTAHQEDKQRLRQEIDSLRGEIAMLNHGQERIEGFDWAVELSEVFVEGGFDIVVANPPYVRQELIRHIKPILQLGYPEIFTGTADLYCYFYARALHLLRSDGMLAFISSNKWFRANYGAKLRTYMAEQCQIKSIMDFGELPVFQTAATFPMVFIAQKDGSSSRTIFTQVRSLDAPYPDILTIMRESGQCLPAGAVRGSQWILADADAKIRLRQMERRGVPLGEYVQRQIYRGILTGFNTAFVLDGAKRAELVNQDPRSVEIIKPLAIGDYIRRWRTEDKDKWLIVTKIGVPINDYPAIFDHLKQWQPQLERRADQGNYWWELRACAHYDAFDKPKIVFPDIAKASRFTFDKAGKYLGNTAYVIPVEDYYLLGVLNSLSVWEYATATFSCLGDPARGGRFRFIYQSVSLIPIPEASQSDRDDISALVQRCLAAKGVGCEAWEAEINERVAALYGL